MTLNRASKRFRIIVFSLTALLTAFAFIHSSMPAEVSDEESTFVLNVLYDIFSFFGLGTDLTDHIVRKLAHFTEFAAIGVMLMSCAYSFDRLRPYRYYSQILLAGLATAVCDETIQLNVAGRSGQITDVLIDISGVVTGALIMLGLFTVYKRIRGINKETKDEGNR